MKLIPESIAIDSSIGGSDFHSWDGDTPSLPRLVRPNFA